MALIGVNPSQVRQKGPSTLEQIALGVDVASKVLGLGLEGYKTFGKPARLATETAEANLAKTRAETKVYENKLNQGADLSDVDKATIKAYGEQNYIPTNEMDNDPGKIMVNLPDSGKTVFYKPGKRNTEKLDSLTARFKDDFVQDQFVKDFRTVHGAVNGVIQAFKGKSLDEGDSGRDLSLLFANMKVLDPGSRVTGSEVELTQGASPVAVQLAQQYNKLWKERGVLDSGLRKSLIQSMKDNYLARQSDYMGIEDQTKTVLKGYDIDPFNVIPKINKIDWSEIDKQLGSSNKAPWEKYK